MGDIATFRPGNRDSLVQIGHRLKDRLRLLYLLQTVLTGQYHVLDHSPVLRVCYALLDGVAREGLVAPDLNGQVGGRENCDARINLKHSEQYN